MKALYKKLDRTLTIFWIRVLATFAWRAFGLTVVVTPLMEAAADEAKMLHLSARKSGHLAGKRIREKILRRTRSFAQLAVRSPVPPFGR